MGGFIEPNIHPVLVHFTFALGVSAAFAYLGAMLVPQERWRTSLRPAADWMLALAAIAVVATIAAGFEAYYTVAHDTPSHEAMTTHRNWAVPSGLALLGLAGWLALDPQGRSSRHPFHVDDTARGGSPNRHRVVGRDHRVQAWPRCSEPA